MTLDRLHLYRSPLFQAAKKQLLSCRKKARCAATASELCHSSATALRRHGMSLSRFLELPEVTAKVKPFRPKLSRKIPAQLQIEPRSTRYATVGTAFDYLLRFELQRRAPHAVSGQWVAEYAPELIWKSDGRVTAFMALRKDERGVVSEVRPPPTWADPSLAKETAQRAKTVIEMAKSDVTAYLKNESPTLSDQAKLASHAIRLAKLDDMFRARRFDGTFVDAAKEDIDDLLAMLAIVPFEPLLHDQVLLLNPDFQEASLLVGGADTDLISGNLLVDFKATKKSEMQARDLDQLFGYVLLARHQRRTNPAFPEIKRLGFYFCRHGHLWVQDVSAWIDHPEFPEVEQWFFERAKEVFRKSREAPAAVDTPRSPSVDT
jgi:hypothetical protein